MWKEQLFNTCSRFEYKNRATFYFESSACIGTMKILRDWSCVDIYVVDEVKISKRYRCNFNFLLDVSGQFMIKNQHLTDMKEMQSRRKSCKSQKKKEIYRKLMRNKSARWWWCAKTNNLHNHEFSIQLVLTWVKIKIGWAWKLINRRKNVGSVCVFPVYFFHQQILNLHSHVRDDSHSQGSSDSLWIFINLFQLSIWNFSQSFYILFYLYFTRERRRNWPHRSFIFYYFIRICGS